MKHEQSTQCRHTHGGGGGWWLGVKGGGWPSECGFDKWALNGWLDGWLEALCHDMTLQTLIKGAYKTNRRQSHVAISFYPSDHVQLKTAATAVGEAGRERPTQFSIVLLYILLSFNSCGCVEPSQ